MDYLYTSPGDAKVLADLRREQGFSVQEVEELHFDTFMEYLEGLTDASAWKTWYSWKSADNSKSEAGLKNWQQQMRTAGAKYE